MFTIDEDFMIQATRGDAVAFYVSCDNGGNPYTFQPGDVLRFKVFERKLCDNVVLEKTVSVKEAATQVGIVLTGMETRLGEVISKPKDYWYEVELNPYTNPQTIVGYDDDGPKIFRIYPEGREADIFIPEESKYPDVDDEFSESSPRPVSNRALTMALLRYEEIVMELQKKVEFLTGIVQGMFEEREGGTNEP